VPVGGVLASVFGLAPGGDNPAGHAGAGGKEHGFAPGEGIVFDVGAAPHLRAAGEIEPRLGGGAIGAEAGAVAARGEGAGPHGGEFNEKCGAARLLPG